MKYSLRSLMIGLTLFCVLLGSVMARVEYLRRWAVFHEQEANRCLNVGVLRGSKVMDIFGRIYHQEMASVFREASYRPWLPVTEPPELASFREKSATVMADFEKAPAPNPPKP